MNYKFCVAANAVTFFIITLFCGHIVAGELGPADTARSANLSAVKRNLAISGLLQLRYTASLTDSVDINGRHFTGSGVTNSFQMKRVRVMIRSNINDHFDANVLVNLAEFTGNTQNRVLENAFIRYHHGKALNIQMGQFRPYFGPEDMFPVDIIKSLDFSNQYYLFGSSGWQSFQMGFSVYGDLNTNGHLPLHYYAGVYNGNNRNQPTDNDNGKNYYGRLETTAIKNVRIGVNAATGTAKNKSGNAWGADITSITPLSHSVKFELMAEYKEGANFSAYLAASDEDRLAVDQYQNRGFYVFPNIRYDCAKPRLRSVEFSSRYEYLQENYKMNNNPRHTITPMVSFEFADDYFARLQVGCTLDLYKKNVPLTTQYNQTTGVVQMQVRF